MPPSRWPTRGSCYDPMLKVHPLAERTPGCTTEVGPAPSTCMGPFETGSSQPFFGSEAVDDIEQRAGCPGRSRRFWPRLDPGDCLRVRVAQIAHGAEPVLVDPGPLHVPGVDGVDQVHRGVSLRVTFGHAKGGPVCDQRHPSGSTRQALITRC